MHSAANTPAPPWWHRIRFALVSRWDRTRLPLVGRWNRYWLRRGLNPAAWWIFSLGLAAAASLTTNPLLTGLLIAVAAVVVASRRGNGPWSRSFRLYVMLGLLIIVVRVLYRLIFGGGDGGTILFSLPQIPLPPWVGGIRLLGPVSAEALIAGFQDGLRLACIVICIGAANSLANPKRLLAQLPNALHEIATVLVVSVTVFAQLADSVERVRRARTLRVGSQRTRHRWIREIVVPVLTDAVDRSLQLATAMDARGYGRQITPSAAVRQISRAMIIIAISLLCLTAWAALAPGTWLTLGAVRLPSWPLIGAAALACGVLGLRVAGRAVTRTRYRAEGWGLAECLTAVCGWSPFVAFSVIGGSDAATLLVPSPGQWPQVTPVMIIALGLALLPGFLTPPPVTDPAEADRQGDLIMGRPS
ncbi:energy-coupling factor transporter transmembrane component T family protein [Naumannella halotolerans]|uniref:Energy-coupling factor transport system permease protein n=1 Tax=Naumannella halotolerans TaxID=993414 RepID=A0A4R7JBW2_9ACTN|nr:energy-coupling factor transporter transmembrane component T [Naumannella halotolerans]TDT34496.1 energy-coupling factor transport system permease protein [Naumannella halotolerans]